MVLMVLMALIVGGREGLVFHLRYDLGLITYAPQKMCLVNVEVAIVVDLHPHSQRRLLNR